MFRFSTLVLCFIALAGCSPDRCNRDGDKVAIAAVIYPDGNFFSVEDGNNMMSASHFSNVIHNVSRRKDIEAAGVYVRPCEWWDDKGNDFMAVISPIAMLTNVHHVSLIVGCTPSLIDASVFRNVNIEELGFSGYEVFPPKCTGLDCLPLRKLMFIDTCSARGLSASNCIDVCACIGLSPRDAELKACFPRLNSILRPDCLCTGSFAEIISNGITKIVYDSFGCGCSCDDTPQFRVSIDVHSRIVRFEIWPDIVHVVSMSETEKSEVLSLLQDAGMMSWKSEYRAPEVQPDMYETWRVTLYSGERSAKEINGCGDVPDGIVAFWRLWCWGMLKVEHANACDPHATYRMFWRSKCFRPFVRKDDDRAYAYLRNVVGSAQDIRGADEAEKTEYPIEYSSDKVLDDIDRNPFKPSEHPEIKGRP